MEIPLRNRNKKIVAHTIVSKEDYYHLSQFKWCLSGNYVSTTIKSKSWLLHRYIMIEILGNEIIPQQPVDHINGLPLDNTRNNLRIVTRSENSRNTKKKDDTSSKYTGVSKKGNKWHAQISIENKRLSAYYDNEIHAAHQYNLWIDEYDLKFANKNKIKEPKNFIKWTESEKRNDDGVILPKGITMEGKKFWVRITIDGNRKSLGYFDKLNDAILELEKAKIEKEENERNRLSTIPKIICFNENGYCFFKVKNFDVIVDEELYYDIIKYNWRIDKHKYCSTTINGKIIKLHRYIMNYNGNDYIDHINTNQLDNRKINLRVATPKQNAMNTSSRKGSSSQYVGVSYYKSRNQWRATIFIDNKQKHVAYCKTEIEAAEKRDIATKKYYNNFGNLNCQN